MIVIFGSYNGTSIGDTAILVGLIASIRRTEAKFHPIRVLTMGQFDLLSELSRFGLAEGVDVVNVRPRATGYVSAARRLIRNQLNIPNINTDMIQGSIAGADRLLIGGGNLIMDLFERWPPLLRVICDAAVKRGIPYSILGVGAGPINTLQGQKALQFCVNFAEHVYVRDVKSQTILKEQFDVAAVLMRDAATAIPTDCIESAEVNQNNLIVNIANVFGANWPYRDRGLHKRFLLTYAYVVRQLSEEYDCAQIAFLNSNVGADGPAFEFLKETLGERRIVEQTVEAPSVAGLLKTARSGRVCLATRLHAALLSKFSGCDLYAVGYQPKVADVLDVCGFDYSYSEIDTFVDGGHFKRRLNGVGKIDTFPSKEILEVDEAVGQVLDGERNF